jgi:hypothetical protein
MGFDTKNIPLYVTMQLKIPKASHVETDEDTAMEEIVFIPHGTFLWQYTLG